MPVSFNDPDALAFGILLLIGGRLGGLFGRNVHRRTQRLLRRLGDRRVSQSLVKLVAFVAARAFVTYGLFLGFGVVFARAKALEG